MDDRQAVRLDAGPRGAQETTTASGISRRALLRGAAGIGLAAAAAPLLSGCGSDEGPTAMAPPETTTIRLPKVALTTAAAMAVASDFLKEEGFTDVQYLSPTSPAAIFSEFAANKFDMAQVPAPLAVQRIDAGDPFVVLGGINAGSFQIYASAAIRSLSDFRGKVITTSGPGNNDDTFLALTLANVGIDFRKEVTVISRPHDQAVQTLISGEADGMTTYGPFSQRLRVDNIGHVVLDANVDRPWSQYFFGLPTVHRDFLEKNPVATRRALRAMFRAADVIAKDPERGAQAMKAQGFIPDALYAATLSELGPIPYDVWRKYEPADTLRFYALRLREAGFIQSTPDEVIRRGADFRFLRDLKRELKEA